MQTIRTDVAIAGSGAAGLRAAIEVQKAGKKALVLSKGPIGLGTATVMSGGALCAAVGGFSVREHKEQTLLAGRGLNIPELADALVNEGPARLRELMDWGMNCIEVEGMLLAKGKPFAWGRDIVRVLGEKAKEAGAKLMGDVFVFDILKKDGRVNGLLAYSAKEDATYHIDCDAVILATGGAGAIFQYHDNPQRMMGEGYALALDAGAKLMDMEFTQFYPLCIVEEGKPSFLFSPKLADKGKIVNELGEDLHEKYNLDQRPVAERMRDRLSQAIWREEKDRPGGKVFVDVTFVSEEDWRADLIAWSSRDVLVRNYGALERPLPMKPASHHTMGGIVIDASCASSVPGLFGAGEITGGVHGANRKGGNALTDTLVFGTRAGRSAAEFIDREGPCLSDPSNTKDRIPSALVGEPKTTGVSPKTLREQLRRLMWEKVGIVRNLDGLTEAKDALGSMLEQASSGLRTATPRERVEALEIQGSVQTCRMIAEAAIRREESRGAHFRQDFPETDDAKWNVHLVLEPSGKGDFTISPVSI